VVLLCCMVVTTSVVAIPPSHKNFSTAEEDLFSILSYLSDTNHLCEQVLLTSYEANASMQFIPSITMDYDLLKKNQSLIFNDHLTAKIGYSTDILDMLDPDISSYQYLSDILLPLKNIGLYCTKVAESHIEFLDVLSILITLESYDSNDSTPILSNLTHAYQTIILLRSTIESIDDLLPDIQTFFLTDQIHVLLNRFSLLLDRYETYLNQFRSLFEHIQPTLVLVTDKTTYYLLDTIVYSGYFIGQQGYVPQHPTDIYFDDILIKTVSTNTQGRLNGTYLIESTVEPTTHSFSSKTMYQDTLYTSQPVDIYIFRIPTYLILHLSSSNVKPAEPIQVRGALSTIYGQPLSDLVQVSVGSTNQIVNTKTDGSFDLEVQNLFSYGSYPVVGRYQPAIPYASCTSEELTISINEPTSLSISSDKLNYTKGEHIKITGRLLLIGEKEPLTRQTIGLYVNGHRVQYTTTNTSGYYQFDFDTTNLTGQILQIYTSYISPVVQWRSTTSKILRLQLFDGFLQQMGSFMFGSSDDLSIYIVFIGFFIILTSSIIVYVFFMRRKREHRAIDHETLVSSTVSVSKPFFSFFSRKNRGSSSDRFSSMPEPLRKKMIATYRMFLRHFIRQGLQMRPASTHRDIQRQLYTMNLPKESVDAVTLGFELARYSPVHLREHDLVSYDEQVYSIITMDKEWKDIV